MFIPEQPTLLPSFLIIGGIKCGTSSLYRYICAHPNVLPCIEKEPGFFSTPSLAKLNNGFENYCKLFPRADTKGAITANWVDLEDDESFNPSHFSKQKVYGRDYLTCEATANIYFRGRPGAVKTVLPQAKIIMLVRNPSERFISHFRMYQRFEKDGRAGFNMPSLEDFIEAEIALLHDKKPSKIIHQGLYVNYLRKWRAVFGNDQVMIIPSTQLSSLSSAQQTMQRITKFLSLPAYDFSVALGTKYNQAKGYQASDAAVARLDAFYASANVQFEKEFGIDLKA